jgi:transposase InsO family protein
MREDKLLCVCKRRFRRHHQPADITDIRLHDDFVFLAVILDAYSRRIIGWALDRSMEDSLTLTALRMALARRAVEPGLVSCSICW